MPPDPDQEKRIASVEETAGFAEHKAEQLDSVITELSSQVYELTARLERLEQRLADLESGDRGEPDAADTQPPPHAHRPL